MTGDKTWRGFIKYNRVFRKCHEEGYWRVIQDNERHILFRLGTAWSVIRLKGMSWGYHRVFLIGLNITYYMRSSKHSLYKRRAMTGVVHLNKNKPAWQCYLSWSNTGTVNIVWCKNNNYDISRDRRFCEGSLVRTIRFLKNAFVSEIQGCS